MLTGCAVRLWSRRWYILLWLLPPARPPVCWGRWDSVLVTGALRRTNVLSHAFHTSLYNIKLPPVVNKLSTNTGGKRGETASVAVWGWQNSNTSFCLMLRLTGRWQMVKTEWERQTIQHKSRSGKNEICMTICLYSLQIMRYNILNTITRLLFYAILLVMHVESSLLLISFCKLNM